MNRAPVSHFYRKAGVTAILAVIVHRKMSEGEEKPLRTQAGNQTCLADPRGVALDPPQ